jgi:hypothetical protein
MTDQSVATLIAKRTNHFEPSVKLVGAEPLSEYVQSDVSTRCSVPAAAIWIGQDPPQSEGVITGAAIQIKHAATETRVPR